MRVRISFNSDLQNGHRIGPPLRPRRTTIWCGNSLGNDKAEIAESVRGLKARDISEKDWFRLLHEGSSKTRFEYCEDSKNSLIYFRVIQGHSGGKQLRLLSSIVYYSHAPHVSTWLIFPASYDEYTALVKSGNAANKHVWKAVIGAYCWWKTWISLLIELCDVSSGYVVVCVLCCFFLQHAWTGVVAQASWYFRTVLWSILCLFSLSRFRSSVCCAVHVAWVCFQ